MPDSNDTTQEAVANTPVSAGENLQTVNEEIYKRNLELAVVNKTLSLLRKLYQISILTLAPAELSEKVSDVVRTDLNFEMVGIFIFDKEADTLTPFSFAKSERMLESLQKQGILLKSIVIPNIASNPLLKATVYSQTSTQTNKLSDIWPGAIEDLKLTSIAEEAHLKTILLYPLLAEDKMLGILIFGLNRDYETLNDHEKDSMKAVPDVIAVALDKAYLYKELQDANEKLKSLDKLKTEFLSLATHQVRGPLTAIKGYASMVIDGDFGEISEKAKEATNRIFESSNNLALIIEDFLNVSKIEGGGMKYEMAPFSLSEISRDMSKDLSIMAEKRGLKLSFEGDPDADCMVNGDREKVRQVVLNFIDNSIKYTKEGDINVSIHKVDGKAVFKVKDTGMGMTPEIKATLFQKFARGDGARMNTTGSGLGLYLAKEIIEAHKGRVWVESDGPNKGSTFGFELVAV
jgi:signal transduction histidine kinase